METHDWVLFFLILMCLVFMIAMLAKFGDLLIRQTGLEGRHISKYRQFQERLKELEETVEVLEKGMVERDRIELEKRRKGRTMHGNPPEREHLR